MKKEGMTMYKEKTSYYRNDQSYRNNQDRYVVVLADRIIPIIAK